MKDLRKDLEKILLELLCKWDKGGLAEEEAEDKILSLFKQQMKEIVKKGMEYRMVYDIVTGKKKKAYYSEFGTGSIEIENKTREEILKNIEKL